MNRCPELFSSGFKLAGSKGVFRLYVFIPCPTPTVFFENCKDLGNAVAYPSTLSDCRKHGGGYERNATGPGRATVWPLLPGLSPCPGTSGQFITTILGGFYGPRKTPTLHLNATNEHMFSGQYAGSIHHGLE